MVSKFEVLNSLPDSVAVLNKKGEIIFTNNSWKSFSNENDGSFNKTDCGVNYLDICSKVTGEELQNAIEAKNGIEKIIKKEIELFELEYPCHSNDEKRWFILRVVPNNSESESIMISHINITKRKLAEESVEEKNNQLNLINEKIQSAIYKIIHDIQSPLSSIEGLINLTKIEKDRHSKDSYLSLIEKSVVNLKKHIQSTLKNSISLSKIESITFKELLNEFYESIKYIETLNKIDYRVNITQNCDFYSHKDGIKSIISNIVSNSLKYYDKTKQESYIIIQIDVDKKNAIISIKDNGIGISEKAINKIFDMYYTVTKNSSIGTGIGLRIVKDSVNKLNGSITVNSTLGQGSEFIITIPNL